MSRRTVKTITDRLILKSIYNRYYDSFCAFEESESKRASKLYVPIDCNAIAKELKIDPDIIFGRLYYHLDKKYRYRQDDGSMVNLFLMKAGRDRHCVNFPLLSAVLAEHDLSYYRFIIPLVLSIVAIILSVISFLK